MVVENKRIKELFYSLQKELSVGLGISRKHVKHPTTLGDVSETKWIEWLNKYLPKRYAVMKGFIVDFKGGISEQIDIIIYDRQYSPFIFTDENVKYIPVESVYCIFEVKQEMNKAYIEYAYKKALSVDALHKTSSVFQAITGQHVKEPFKILRGILTTDSKWKDGIESKSFKKIVNQNNFDLGCSINDRSFSLEENNLKISDKDESLIFFFLKLLSMLTKLGTVPALSIDEYAKALDSNF